MGSVDLIVTDLDGTLWSNQYDVHPDAARALGKVVGGDVPLLVATGRRVTSTRVPLIRLGVSPPAVVLNGAVGLELSTGERFHCAAFDAIEADKVLTGFRSVGLDPCLYVDDPSAEVLLSSTPSTHPRHVEGLGATAAVTDLAQAVMDTPVLAFGIIGVDYDILAAAAAVLDGMAEVHLDRAFDLPNAAITVAPRGQSKWDGVVAYCDREGLDAGRVLALADGPNDIELLRNAAVRLVPENAHAPALALADHVIPAAEAGGWRAVLDFI